MTTQLFALVLALVTPVPAAPSPAVAKPAPKASEEPHGWHKVSNMPCKAISVSDIMYTHEDGTQHLQTTVLCEDHTVYVWI